MEYQKIINLLDYTPNQTAKFRINSQIKFKNWILNSILCDYSDAYILVSGTISVEKLAASRGNKGIEVVFKNCALSTDCISKINNAQIDNAKDINLEKPMYDLIEHRDYYSKTSGSLWQYYRDGPALTDVDGLDNFPGNSPSFKFKQKITGSIGDNGTKNVKIISPLTYLSNFWRTLKMSLINCEINIILTWSANCVMSSAAVN